MKTTIMRSNKLSLICNLSISVFVFLVYLGMLCHGVYPGQSAAMMATYTGIEDKIAPLHPIWGSIVACIASIAGHNFPLWLNFFSLICGVVAVSLIFSVVFDVFYLAMNDKPRIGDFRGKLSVIGASVAAFILAFSAPMLITSTRLHFQSFDLVLLLLVAKLLVCFLRSGKFVPLLAMSLLLGAGIVDCLALVFCVPFVFFFVIKNIIVSEQGNKGGKIFLSFLFFAIGLGLYWLTCYMFCQNNDISIRNYDGALSVFKQMYRDQWYYFKNGIPALGWVYVFIFVIAPFFAALSSVKRAFGAVGETSALILHIVMTAFVFITIVNTPVSRWGIEEAHPQGALPTFLYAMTAFTAGYVITYYFALRTVISNLRDGRDDPIVKAQYAVSYPCIVVTIVAGVIALLSNTTLTSAKRGDFATECSNEFLKHMDGRDILVSDGILDMHIRIASAILGQHIQLIDISKSYDKIYQRQIKKFIDTNDAFKDLDRVKLKNAVDLSVEDFIVDWIVDDPSVLNRMAITSASDIFIQAGVTPVPNYFCFVGTKEEDAIKDFDLGGHQEFWKKMRTLLAQSRREVNDEIDGVKSMLRRHICLVANNVGVFLEDVGRNEEAYSIYTDAHSFDPDNISISLNRFQMLTRLKDKGFHSEDLPLVDSELKTRLEDKNFRPLSSMVISRYYGYIRNPELFVSLGMTWANSGRAAEAKANIKRAKALATTDAELQSVKNAEADMMLRNDELDGAEKVFLDILDDKPDDFKAILQMAKLETRRKNFDKAREWLTKVEDDERLDEYLHLFALCEVDMAEKKYDVALEKILKITDKYPRFPNAISFWAICLANLGKIDEAERIILPKIEAIYGSPDNYLTLITRAQIALMRGPQFFKGARDDLLRATEISNVSIGALEQILTLDRALADKEGAEKTAMNILRIERTNPFANYIMGSLMLDKGMREEAETYYRMSITAKPSVEALNDLAYLLATEGKIDEADKFIHQAIDLSENYYPALDTLGFIYDKEGKSKDAEAAYEKAVEISGGSVDILINFADFLYRNGNMVRARKIVSDIYPKRNELDDVLRTRLEELLGKVNKKR